MWNHVNFGLRTLAAAVLVTCAGTDAVADPLSSNGQDLYVRYCAACHGKTGLGDGPVAPSFKVEMPDLTTIARRHGGKFPREQIVRIIDGRYMIFSHGSREMPIWGEGFMRAEIGNADANRVVDLLIGRMVDYLETLQRQAPTAEKK